MRRRWISATSGARRGAACLAASVALLVASATAEARVFRAADNQVADYPTVQALIHMGELIRERSGGRHDIQVFHSRQLGEEADTLEQTRAGAIDINRVNVAPLARSSPVASVLAMPFLFRSEEHLHRVIEGRIGEEILASFEAQGFVGLTYYDSGTRSVYNARRSVRVPADLQGLRIRVQPSDPMVDVVRALGAEPVPLPYGQVVSALQTGLIDGAENNWPSYVSNGHFLRARYITETNHTMPPEVLLFSARSWAYLTAADQAMFRQAARDSSLFMRARWRQWVADARLQAATLGVEIVTEFDRSAFEAAAAGVADRYLRDPVALSLRDRIREAP